jgi:hypothetical protein
VGGTGVGGIGTGVGGIGVAVVTARAAGTTEAWGRRTGVGIASTGIAAIEVGAGRGVAVAGPASRLDLDLVVMLRLSLGSEDRLECVSACRST